MNSNENVPGVRALPVFSLFYGLNPNAPPFMIMHLRLCVGTAQPKLLLSAEEEKLKEEMKKKRLEARLKKLEEDKSKASRDI